jgi:hypothetical protein
MPISQSNLSKYTDDLDKLIKKGNDLFNAIQYDTIEGAEEQFKKHFGSGFEKFKKEMPSFRAHYQIWYSEAQALIKLLLPDRLADFIRLYEKPKGRKDITFDNYVIEDYLHGLRVTRANGTIKIATPDAAVPKFEQQVYIVQSAKKRFESSLFDIKQLVQADLFDEEIEVAKELLKNKFLRAAGAVAGVVLERHLKQVCENHNLGLTKKNPTINDFNETLKNNNVIDTAQWRFIQHLGDLRNLCDHNKSKEPTINDITDLTDGVSKIIKTLF